MQHNIYIRRSSEYCSFQNLEREEGKGSFDDEMNNKIRHKNPDLVNFAAGLTLLMIKFNSCFEVLKHMFHYLQLQEYSAHHPFTTC